MYYRKSLSSKLNSLEKDIDLRRRSVLIIDMNADGTYGADEFTEEELAIYIDKEGYEVVIIDDILNM